MRGRCLPFFCNHGVGFHPFPRRKPLCRSRRPGVFFRISLAFQQLGRRFVFSLQNERSFRVLLTDLISSAGTLPCFEVAAREGAPSLLETHSMKNEGLGSRIYLLFPCCCEFLSSMPRFLLLFFCSPLPPLELSQGRSPHPSRRMFPLIVRFHRQLPRLSPILPPVCRVLAAFSSSLLSSPLQSAFSGAGVSPSFRKRPMLWLFVRPEFYP